LGERVYHLELRHFPRNLCRFNMSEEELRATVLEPWASDRVFELGELKWDPRHARLTVLEGPRMPPEQLSMGRGWRAAQRQSRDVTAQLLSSQDRPAVGEQTASPSVVGQAVRRSAAGASTLAGETDLAADSLGLELLAQMGSERIPLRRAWELAATRDPGGPASDALALAERAVASLLRSRLVVLLRAAGSSDTAPEPVEDRDATLVLGSLESWIDPHVWVRRA
jgi:hypothetical protein